MTQSSKPASSSASEQSVQSPRPLRELPKWLVIVVIAAVLLLTAVVLGVLLWQIDKAAVPGAELLNAQLDAVKIAASVAVGGGGLFALYLAVRRQRTTEADLRLRDRTQTHAEFDSQQRRVTDLYAKAVDQFGSDNPVVRLGGLYALERLGQDNPTLRQTIVNVVCAYLRTPYRPVVPKDRKDRASVGLRHAFHNRYSLSTNTLEGRQPASSTALTKIIVEGDVRRACQRLLRDHLRADRDGSDARSNPECWCEVTTLDLTGAVLVDFDLSGCVVPESEFVHAQFLGGGYFKESVFSGRVDFRSAHFPKGAFFQDVKFLGSAVFWETSFGRQPYFWNVTFELGAIFDDIAAPEGVDFGSGSRAFAREGQTWPPGWGLDTPSHDNEPGRLVRQQQDDSS